MKAYRIKTTSLNFQDDITYGLTKKVAVKLFKQKTKEIAECHKDDWISEEDFEKEISEIKAETKESFNKIVKEINYPYVILKGNEENGEVLNGIVLIKSLS